MPLSMGNPEEIEIVTVSGSMMILQSFPVMQSRKWHNKKVFEEILKKDAHVQCCLENRYIFYSKGDNLRI